MVVKTKLHYLSIYREFFDWAKTRGYIKETPFAFIHTSDLPKLKKKEPGLSFGRDDQEILCGGSPASTRNTRHLRPGSLWRRPPKRHNSCRIVAPKIKLVSIIAIVQSSKTTSPELTLCYIIANLPGPCLWLDQADDDANEESESRLQKFFEFCEPVKRLSQKNKNKQKNCAIHF